MIDATTDGNPTRGVIDARNAIPEVTRSPIVRTERCFCRSYILPNADVIPEKPSIAIETSANRPSISRFTFNTILSIIGTVNDIPSYAVTLSVGAPTSHFLQFNS